MSTPFSRTTRSLGRDSFRRSTLTLIIAVAVLASWACWLLLSSVPLYEFTESARLEVDSAVHPVESPAFGRVIATHLAIGRQVKAGDILVELDSGAQRLQLDEEVARLAALTGQAGALHERRAAEQQAQAETQLAVPITLDESRARHEEAQAIARSSAEEVKRLERLHASGLVSEIDVIRARAEAEKRQAAADALPVDPYADEYDQRADRANGGPSHSHRAGGARALARRRGPGA